MPRFRIGRKTTKIPREIGKAFWPLGDLRTFPNKHKDELDIQASIFLNQFGKLMENLQYVYREMLDKKFIPAKVYTATESYPT